MRVRDYVIFVRNRPKEIQEKDDYVAEIAQVNGETVNLEITVDPYDLEKDIFELYVNNVSIYDLRHDLS